MSLPMTRPFKHPRTGIYWIRKRVPADLYPLVGSKEVHRSLKTKDAIEAKSRVVEALADIERQWASLRAGRRTLTEREAHERAQRIFENWLEQHRDFPSPHWPAGVNAARTRGRRFR